MLDVIKNIGIGLGVMAVTVTAVFFLGWATVRYKEIVSLILLLVLAAGLIVPAAYIIGATIRDHG